MDDQSNIPAIRVVAVNAVGTTGDGQGYVECDFADAGRAAVCFSPEVAQSLCRGFLAAAGKLEEERPLSEQTVVPIPLKAARVNVGVALQGDAPPLVLTLTLPEGATLNFLLPVEMVERMALQAQMAARGNRQSSLN